MKKNDMWKHTCPVDGEMEIGKGEECSWCGAKEPRPHLRLVKG